MRSDSPQLEIDLRPRTWGGARAGAGRKRDRERREPPHRTRRDVRHYNPLHIVLRARAEIPRLRTPRMFVAVRDVLRAFVVDSELFRVCHISIQSNHLHLIIEAANKLESSRGMRRLNTALSRAINRELGRSGAVFAFRYHDTHITSPRHARHTLLYVLNNWRHHREDRRHPGIAIDPYSSGYSFDGWSAPVRAPSFTPLQVAAPRSWLLRVGWRRHGLLRFDEVPVAESTKPAVESAKPDAESTKPAAESIKPTAQSTKRAAESAKPMASR